jgi:hypothetical protein
VNRGNLAVAASPSRASWRIGMDFATFVTHANGGYNMTIVVILW